MADFFAFDPAAGLGNVGSLLLAAALFAAALLSLAASSAAAVLRGTLPGDSAFWRLLAMALLLLSANSLLEGELMLGGWLRELARAEHWYEWRRPLQFVVVALALFLAGVAIGRLRRVLMGLRYPLQPVKALGGLALLGLLPLLRGVSFHYTDELVYSRIAGLALGRWVELAGLSIIALSAWRQWRLMVALQALRDR